MFHTFGPKLWSDFEKFREIFIFTIKLSYEIRYIAMVILLSFLGMLLFAELFGLLQFFDIDYEDFNMADFEIEEILDDSNRDGRDVDGDRLLEEHAEQTAAIALNAHSQSSPNPGENVNDIEMNTYWDSSAANNRENIECNETPLMQQPVQVIA